jgi:hypothetical protein
LIRSSDVLDLAHGLPIESARMLLLRLVLEGVEVEGVDLLADLLVEAALGLLTEPALFDHLGQELGDLERVALGIGGQRVVAVVRHVHEGVEADEVGGAEHGALGPAGGRAEDRVELLDGEAVAHHRLQGVHHRVGADAVGDEVRRVLAEDDALAEHVGAEDRHLVEGLLVGLLAGDELEQAHEAHRVEEVGHEEVTDEVVAAALDHLGDAQARGVGGDHRARLAQLVDPREEASA